MATKKTTTKKRTKKTTAKKGKIGAAPEAQKRRKRKTAAEGKMSNLREAYFAMKGSRHESDFNLATLLTAMWRELEEEAFRDFCTNKDHGLGMNNTSLTRSMAMLTAIRLIPQKTVWVAVGWRGISRLRKGRNGDLKAALQSVTNLYRKVGRTLSDRELHAIMEKHLPAVLAAQEQGRKARNRVYVERELLVDAVHYAVEQYPQLHGKLARRNKDVLVVAGLPQLTSKKGA